MRGVQTGNATALHFSPGGSSNILNFVTLERSIQNVMRRSQREREAMKRCPAVYFPFFFSDKVAEFIVHNSATLLFCFLIYLQVLSLNFTLCIVTYDKAVCDVESEED